MRISTSQMYDTASASVSRAQNDLYKLQSQLSSGRRILSPADDPVASARTLVMTQSKEVNAQYAENQGTASSLLGMVDGQLTSLTDLLHNVRDRAVQAGNTILSNTDRQAIATELEARYGELLGIANSQNGLGDYMFSGFQGATRPFAQTGGAAVAPATASPVAYSGDDGQRLLQVSASRQMAASVAGSDLFMNAKSGNGSFVTATAGNAGGINQGTATIDSGSVVDSQQWQVALNGFGWSTPASPELQIRFTAPGGVTSYQLFNGATAVSTVATFTAGQAIPLATTAPPAASATNFGAQVVIEGQPAAGDSFSIKPAANQSLFQTVQNMIGILRQPVGSAAYSNTEFTNALGAQLTNLDQALSNVGRVQATVGANMRELDSLSSNAAALDVQYQQSLSSLQDLDYAAAISDFTKQQMSLEAAQKTFVKVSGMNLFNYL